MGTNVFRSNQSSSILGTPTSQPLTKMPAQKDTEAQMQDHENKGLYYFYEEK